MELTLGKDENGNAMAADTEVDNQNRVGEGRIPARAVPKTIILGVWRLTPI